MANFQLRALPNGFQRPTGANAHEVLMAYHGRENKNMVVAKGAEILWTQGMSDCRSVATYTPSTGKRSLTHLQGGNPSDDFYATLKSILDRDSRIIFIAGGSDLNPADFKGRIFESFRDETKKKLRKAGMASPPPFAQFEAYWSNAAPNRSGSTGFVFQPDGRFGILNPNGESK